MMLAKASCMLLLATVTLAARHHVYNGIHTRETTPIYPIDYNEQLTMKNPMVRPGTNIIFNFEQIRRDQPPLIDIREEDIGKYIGRRRTTTTTTTTPVPTTPAPTTTTQFPTTILPSASEESSEEINYEVPVPVPVRPKLPPQAPYWPAPMGTTTKPVIRAFHDFSDALDIPDSSKIEWKARYPDVDRWPHVALGTPPPPPTPKWEEFENERRRPEQPTNRDYYQYHPTEFVPIFVTETTRTTSRSPQRKVHRHRGERKNFWEEASTFAPTAAPDKAPVAPTNGGRGPPPPVPTLTPWDGDSFRK